MATAFTALASTTLGSTATSITFSSISGSYRDLFLVVDPYVSSASYYETLIQFNSDTSTSNYLSLYLSGSGSSVSAANLNTYGAVPISGPNAISAGSGERANAFAHIMDYATTDRHKTVLCRSNNSAWGSDMAVGRWSSTAAVTSITVKLRSGTWGVGASFALYGVK